MNKLAFVLFFSSVISMPALSAVPNYTNLNITQVKANYKGSSVIFGGGNNYGYKVEPLPEICRSLSGNEDYWLYTSDVNIASVMNNRFLQKQYVDLNITHPSGTKYCKINAVETLFYIPRN